MSNDRFEKAKGGGNNLDKSDDLGDLPDRLAKVEVKSNNEAKINDGDSGLFNCQKDVNKKLEQLPAEFRHGFQHNNRGRRSRGDQSRLQSNHIRQNDNIVGKQGQHSNYENKTKQKMVEGRNTIEYGRSYKPPDIRVVHALPDWTSYNRPYNHRDVVVVNGLFKPKDPKEDEMLIYKNLLREYQSSKIDQEKLWAPRHGDAHVMADDKSRLKKNCPTFRKVVKMMADYFKMDVKETRFNWYRDSTEWKPFHHDAAAIYPDIAKTQNITVGASFGMEREAAFEHAKKKTILAVPLYNGSIYTFGKEVNVTWRHGIPAIDPSQYKDEGRISIIVWGWIDGMIED